MRMSEREIVFEAFRRWGYLQARIDPFDRLCPVEIPELAPDGEIAEEARRIYCGSVGVEFMHIPDAERRMWIQGKMEAEAVEVDRRSVLTDLVYADIFEQVLQARYPGTKRFSLEGLTSLIPLLTEILNTGSGRGIRSAILGMSHRGRLNVMAHILCKSPLEIFAEFEDVDPRSILGGGDVKYHLGATGEFLTRAGDRIDVRLVSNPSHLEAVDPVVMGRVRAKHTRLGPGGAAAVLPIIIHGDAALAGQGIASETLDLAHIEGYGVGGIIHIVGNNLIGFTANPDELYSSRFASDVAKRLPIPIFHVNAEEPDSVVRVGRLALEYRVRFGSGAMIDLIGYRRHGHSEIEDPSITQPLLYEKIKSHPPLWKIYADEHRLSADPIVEKAQQEYHEARDRASTVTHKPHLSVLPEYWEPFIGGPYSPAYEVETGVALKRIEEAIEVLTRLPAGFSLHPRLKRTIEKRSEMGQGKVPVDFATGELLAFATLLQEGVPIRISGQDSRRGTFGQRNAVLIDVKNEKEYVPLQNVHPQQPRFEIYNSILSEAAVLGFEFGFSRDYPEALTIWEAQFGDFANGAQVIIDQFVATSEDKWDLLSGLVLLLPHGYEGQGAEHSSARIERFLQLAAEDNIQLCQPSNAAQYFHLLRRQVLRRWRKPLIVFTPKSMLRHLDASSPLEDLSRAGFIPVVPDSEVDTAQRVIVCSGKIGHELKRERARLHADSTAVVFLDQFYPFPQTELATEIQRHASMRELVWVQEEPANMGLLQYILPRLNETAGGVPVRSVKRSISASPATGSLKAHEIEQKTLLNLAFYGSID